MGRLLSLAHVPQVFSFDYPEKEYALKFYSLSQLNKTNKLYAIKRSMKIVQSLKSPYIIKLYDFFYDGERLLIQYEACLFGNLH